MRGTGFCFSAEDFCIFLVISIFPSFSEYSVPLGGDGGVSEGEAEGVVGDGEGV